MEKQITELIFILDRSGSMAGLEKDTIGGFNAMIEKQKQQPGQVLVSTLLFDHLTQVIHDRVPLEKISPMTDQDYFVRGSTALMDALGGAIHHIRNIHKYAKPEDLPQKTLFVITTDGMENASHLFSAREVRAMVEQQQELGWEFLFLGANIDAAETAGHLGIKEDRAVNYCCDSEGTALNYRVIGEAVSDLRRSSPLSASWKNEIEQDFQKRGRKA